MKTLLKLLSLLTVAGFVLTSCEGPAGVAGLPGKDGDNGINGIDANESCTLCHSSSATIEAKLAQWGESVHAKGENAAYAVDRATAQAKTCVPCHTSQGFLEAVREGSIADVSVPVNPMQINCYTCHKIHDTFTDDDWALTKPGAESLRLKYAGVAVTYNRGSSNQCVACHQALDVSPAPVLDGPDFAITNTRMGVHHGPMSNFLLGKIPFDVLPGTTMPTTNPHDNPAGCITCHMATPYGYTAGGHNMGMNYSAHGAAEKLNAAGCLTCHPTYTQATITTKLNVLRGEVQSQLDELEAQLTTYGVYSPGTGLAVAGTWKANAVLAYLNFSAVREDKSLGVHNPMYTKALLDNSIAAMTAILPVK